MLRAILSGRMAFVEAALADLTGLGRNRIAGLMLDASGAGFAALHRRAGLPEALLPAFAGALSAWQEAMRGSSDLSEAALSRRMIERALTACETMPFAEAASIMALLSRYEAEAARDEARLVAKAIGEVAQAEEQSRLDAEVVDAEWRDAKNQVPRPQITKVPDYADLEATAATTVTDIAIRIEVDPIAAVLDALPGALLSEFTQARERQRDRDDAPVADDAIPDALVASYRADRERLAA
jgi:hypothetical protein